MKIKLQIKRTPDSAIEYYYTNLFVITEWEKHDRGRVGNLANDYKTGDIVAWMYYILKMRGEQLPDTWSEWLKQNPEMEISHVLDETDPNPTDAAPTVAN
jgi:hypothetical protein